MLAAKLFGNDFGEVRPDGSPEVEPKAVLLALLAADPHSGFNREMRRRAVTLGVNWEVNRQSKTSLEGPFDEYEPKVARALFSGESDDQQGVWATWLEVAESAQVMKLSLRGCSGIKTAAPLAGLKGLVQLDLKGTGVKDLSPLAGLQRLMFVDLSGTGVTDLSPLAGLQGLGVLKLSGTGVTDLSPLAGLQG